MPPVNSEPITTCHVVVLPYPGRGHINPMMNLCNLLSSRCHLISISFVVTEEWLGLIGSEQKPDNIRFVTIPNVLPSERVRSADMLGFINATLTKMEEPFEQLLDRLVVPPTVILADVFVSWVVDVGKRRNIPAALLWPMPASVFSIFYHFDLLVQNGQFPTDLTGRGDELVDYIPGLSPIKISDLPSIIHDNDKLVQNVFKVLSNVPKAQYLLFTSIFELEALVFESLKPKFPFPLYPVGPLIHYLNNKNTITSTNNYPDYLKWLDSQAQSSVLYVSLGSFLSTSGSQMDEIISGLCNSGVRFLLVARDKALTVKVVSQEIGIVVPWCDQLRVLCHPSIGGFWTHCGWSSTMESVYAGVPMIGFPLFMDQPTASKIISEDWKIGWKLKGGEWGSESLVKRDEIAKLVGRFMDPENNERKELAMRARQIQEICHGAIQDGGSTDHNLRSFIRNIFK